MMPLMAKKQGDKVKTAREEFRKEVEALEAEVSACHVHRDRHGPESGRDAARRKP